MKKFVIHILAFGAIILIISGLVYFLCPQNSDSYLYEYKDKCKLMRTIPSPRIIFVGGSNVAFGLNSPRIADSLSISVINNGLHAGLGLEFMLDGILPYVRKDDVVILAPEYTHFYGTSAYGEAHTLPFILDIDVSSLQNMNFHQLCNIIRGLPSLLLGRLDFCFNLIIDKNNPTTFEYKRSGFNLNGDEVSHWHYSSKHITPGNTIREPFNDTFFQNFVGIISDLKKKCTVLLMPPAIQEETFNNQKNNIIFLRCKLQEEGIDYIADPSMFAYSSDCLFDSYYHLNKKGVDLNTDRIISILQSIVK